MTKQGSLIAVILLISIVTATKKSSQTPTIDVKKVLAGSPQDSIFGKDLNFVAGQSADARFQAIEDIIAVQEKYVKKSPEELTQNRLTFATVCDKTLMSSVESWIDQYCAKEFYTSRTSSLQTAVKLYEDVKIQVTSLSAYKAQVELYSDEVFSEMSRYFFLHRQRFVLNFLNNVLGFNIKIDTTYKEIKNAKTLRFLELLKTSAFSVQTLANTADSYMLEVGLFYAFAYKKFSTSWTLQTLVGFKPNMADKGVDGRTEYYWYQLLESIQKTCSMVVRITYLALGYENDLTPAAELAKMTGSMKTTMTSYVETFFNKFNRLLFRSLNNNGQVLTEEVQKTIQSNDPNFVSGPIWPVYLPACGDEYSKPELVYANQIDLLIKIKIGFESSAVLKPDFRRCLTFNFFKSFQVAQGTFTSLDFDSTVFYGFGKEPITYEILSRFKENKQKLHFKFYQDLDKIGIEGMKDFAPSDCTFFMREWLDGKGKLEAEQKGEQSNEYKLWRENDHINIMITGIYRVYLFLREKTTIVANSPNDLEAKFIYGYIFQALTKKETVDLFLKSGYMNVADFVNYWLPMVLYSCHKSGQGDCAFDEKELGLIVDTYGISLKLIIVKITITKKIETWIVKRTMTEYITNIVKLLISFNFGEILKKCWIAEQKTFNVECVEWKGGYVKFTQNFLFVYFGSKSQHLANVKLTIAGINHFLSIAIDGPPQPKMKDLFISFWVYFIREMRTWSSGKAKPPAYYDQITVIEIFNHLRLMLRERGKVPIPLGQAEALFTLLRLSKSITVGASTQMGINIKIDTEYEFQLIMAFIYFGLFQTVTTKEYSTAYNIGQEDAKKEVISIMNWIIAKNQGLAQTLKRTDAGSWATYFQSALAENAKGDWEILGIIVHMECFLSTFSFYTTFKFSNDQYRNFMTEKYQNPTVVLINFLLLTAKTAVTYYGLPNNFYTYVWTHLDNCMSFAATYDGSKPETVKECKWSYRKYAELYYFVKYDFQEVLNQKTGTELVHFHKSSEILIHHRLFFAIAYSSANISPKITAQCQRLKETDFCVVWDSLAVVYENVRSTSPNPKTPAELFNILAGIYQIEKTKHITENMRFNLVSMCECLDYFLGGKPLNYDRFAVWMDPYKFNGMAETGMSAHGLTLYKDAIWDLPGADDKNKGYVFATAKSYMTKYLKLSYFKNVLEGHEYPLRSASKLVMGDTKIFNRIIQFADTVNLFAVKALLIFCRTQAEFEMASTIFFETNRILQAPYMNNPRRDSLIDLVIKAVSCKPSADPNVPIYSYNDGVFSVFCQIEFKNGLEMPPTEASQRFLKVIQFIFGVEGVRTTAGLKSRFKADREGQIGLKEDTIKIGDVVGIGVTRQIQQQIVLIQETDKDINQKNNVVVDVIKKEEVQQVEEEFIDLKIRLTSDQYKAMMVNVAQTGAQVIYEEIVTKSSSKTVTMKTGYKTTVTSNKSGSAPLKDKVMSQTQAMENVAKEISEIDEALKQIENAKMNRRAIVRRVRV